MASGKRLAGRTEAALNGLLEFRSLFEESPDANFLIEDGVFVDCNQSVLDMFGFTDKGSVVGKDLPTFLLPCKWMVSFLPKRVCRWGPRL
jgi:PAS domain-containing protein